MRIAAYQSRIAYGHVSGAIPALRMQVDRCEANGVEVLCCAEGILGGLADYVDAPSRIAVRVDDGELARLLAPLASNTVTSIVGFTELGVDGRLYNAAAVWSRGSVVGVYRKRNPAIRRSVYHAGNEYPVFSIGTFRFGIMICRDSVFPEIAQALVARDAQALFIPTNTGMPASRGGVALVADARRIDIACAKAHAVPVIRADVVGEWQSLISHGSTGIVDRHGRVVCEASMSHDNLLVADLETGPPRDRGKYVDAV